jgi:photosystem II stability/assembly factor-like uncharacterized protein
VIQRDLASKRQETNLNRPQPPPNGAETESKTLELITPDLGWVGTEKGIYVPAKSGDGWEQIEIGTVTDIDFVDESHGWALMDFSLWQTTDGGRHWTRLPHSCGEGTARISFTSRSDGWLLCGGQGGTGMQGKSLHHTTDGGQNWQLIAEASGPGMPSAGALPRGGYVSDLFFLDSQHGWISLGRGSVISTADGGQTWTGTGGIEVEAVMPSTVRFFSPSTGLLLLQRAGLQATADGGRTWQPLYPGLRPASPLPSQMLTPTDWLAVGRLNDSGAILWSTNQGQDWQQVGSLRTQVRSVSFLDRQHGWALDDKGGVHATTDGGVSWQFLTASPSGAEEQFFRLQFFNREQGYAISGWGHLYETTDGGQTWAPVNLEHGTSETAFVTPAIGWRTKEFSLYGTADGGKTWQPIGLQTRVVDFALTSPETGWVVGGEPRQLLLYRTQDGGKSWTQYDLGPIRPAVLRFSDQRHGVFMDQDGRLFSTTDAGDTWVELP